MAKKKSRHYPVVRMASLSPQGAASSTKILLVDRELSKLNRRLYRSGRYYQVKIDIDHNESNHNYVVLALRDDWAVQKAFQTAYQTYLDNTMEERDAMSSNVISRWEDFRTDPGLAGAQSVVSSLWDETIAPVALTSGEFTLSQVVDDTDTTRTFTWKPVAGASEFSILSEYDKVSNAQTTPNTAFSGQAYSGLTGEQNDDTVAHLANAANAPPYEQTGVNTLTPWVKIAELGATAGAQRLSTGFFTAPCGFVVIYSTTGNVANATFEVKAGDYKGVHAPSMVEVATVNRKRKVVK